MSCAFCERIRDGQFEPTGFGRIVTFEPLNPVVPGHRLFVPRRHLGNASDHPGLTGDAFAAAAAWAARRSFEYNLITSAGPNATQTVFHLHVHLVPRRQGDGLHLPWTGQQQRPEWPPCSVCGKPKGAHSRTRTGGRLDMTIDHDYLGRRP